MKSREDLRIPELRETESPRSAGALEYGVVGDDLEALMRLVLPHCDAKVGASPVRSYADATARLSPCFVPPHVPAFVRSLVPFANKPASCMLSTQADVFHRGFKRRDDQEDGDVRAGGTSADHCGSSFWCRQAPVRHGRSPLAPRWSTLPAGFACQRCSGWIGAAVTTLIDPRSWFMNQKRTHTHVVLAPERCPVLVWAADIASLSTVEARRHRLTRSKGKDEYGTAGAFDLRRSRRAAEGQRADDRAHGR